MPNLDRFAVGLPDMQDCDYEVIAGQCSECGEEIHVGEEVREWNGFYFCNSDCLAEKIGAEKTVA